MTTPPFDDEMSMTSSAGGTFHSLVEKQILAMREEIEANELAYRHRKALLEEDLKHHDNDYKTKAEFFQKKLETLQEEATEQEEVHKRELSALQASWKDKLDDLLLTTESARQREKEERIEALRSRDEQITCLFETVNKQKEQLEEVQKEMKNVLVTLHFQHEHFTEATTVQAENLEALRGDHNKGLDTIKDHLHELTTYVDSVQYDVSSVQEQMNTTIQEVAEEQTVARETMQAKIQQSMDFKFADLESQIEEFSKELEIMGNKHESLRSVHEDNIKPFHEKTSSRFDEVESRMDSLKKDVLGQLSSATGNLLVRLQQNSTEQAKTFESGTTELKEMVQSQAGEIRATKQEIAAVSSKCDAVELNVANVRESCNKLIEDAQDKMIGEVEAFAAATKIDFDNLRSDVKSTEESWSSKLDELSAARKVDKDDILVKVMTQVEEISETKREMVALSSKCDVVQDGIETANDNWNSKFGEMQASIAQTHDTFAAATYSSIDNIRTEIMGAEERLGSKLDELSTEVFQGTETQAATNAELRESIGSTNTKIDQTNQRVIDLEDKMTVSFEKHETFHLDMIKAQENFDTRKAEVDQRLQTCDEEIKKVAGNLEFHDAQQALTNSDFEDKLGDFVKQLALVSSEIEKNEQHIQAVSDETPKTIEEKLKPVIEQQGEHGTKLLEHTKEIVLVKGDLKSSDKKRDSIDEKVDTMSKTWESLFQHMVSQVKTDTQSLRSIKTESEALLKEVRKAVAAVDEKFEDFVVEQASAQSELKSEVQLNMLEE